MLLGLRIEPPISVPQPTRDPCDARRADSPPDEPPGVKEGSRGLTVSPQSGLSVSAILKPLVSQILDPYKSKSAWYSLTMILWGKLVFAMMTAPSWRIIVTTAASSRRGENARPTYPRDESSPRTSNWSFKETGMPCSGPIGLPNFRKWLSSSRALSTASANNISVKQFVYGSQARLASLPGDCLPFCKTLSLYDL